MWKSIFQWTHFEGTHEKCSLVITHELENEAQDNVGPVQNTNLSNNISIKCISQINIPQFSSVLKMLTIHNMQVVKCCKYGATPSKFVCHHMPLQIYPRCGTMLTWIIWKLTSYSSVRQAGEGKEKTGKCRIYNFGKACTALVQKQSLLRNIKSS